MNKKRVFALFWILMSIAAFVIRLSQMLDLNYIVGFSMGFIFDCFLLCLFASGVWINVRTLISGE